MPASLKAYKFLENIFFFFYFSVLFFTGRRLVWVLGLPVTATAKAIRLHYGCAYAILINMPDVLFSLFDHVTAHRSDTLCEPTAEEISMWQIFYKIHPPKNVITLFLNNCINRMCYSRSTISRLHTFVLEKKIKETRDDLSQCMQIIIPCVQN